MRVTGSHRRRGAILRTKDVANRQLPHGIKPTLRFLMMVMVMMIVAVIMTVIMTVIVAVIVAVVTGPIVRIFRKAAGRTRAA